MQSKASMTHLLYGIAICVILTLSVTNAQSVPGDMVLIEYETDICAADDLGLKRLNYEDVHQLLEK